MNQELFKQVKIDPKNIDGSLETIRERRLSKIQGFSVDKLKELRGDIQKEIEAEWDQKWIELSPGKDVIEEFCRQHIEGSLNTIFPILIELLTKKIAQLGRIHQDVKRVITMIYKNS